MSPLGCAIEAFIERDANDSNGSTPEVAPPPEIIQLVSRLPFPPK